MCDFVALFKDGFVFDCSLFVSFGLLVVYVCGGLTGEFVCYFVWLLGMLFC